MVVLRCDVQNLDLALVRRNILFLNFRSNFLILCTAKNCKKQDYHCDDIDYAFHLFSLIILLF